MSYQHHENNDDNLMSEINVTPFVDVLLVLLIIFLVTLPVMNHSIKLELPQSSNQIMDSKSAHIEVTILANGLIHWDGKPIDDSSLAAYISLAAQTKPLPELQIRADRAVPYERVAYVLSTAQTNGLTKIGFVTDPPKK